MVRCDNLNTYGSLQSRFGNSLCGYGQAGRDTERDVSEQKPSFIETIYRIHI